MWTGDSVEDGIMLTDEEQREIGEELSRYENRQAACIDALRIVQHHRGWVSDETLHDLAEFIGMTTEELDAVATFYNLIFREPVGKHVIFMCDSITCWIMGYERMRVEMSGRLGVQMGETTRDGKFTLLPTVCLGTCDHAPAMMVDEDLHRDLAPGQIDGILAKYK